MQEPDFIPRPHQEEAAAAILAARAAGRPGFLLGDLTGLGKTLSACLAMAAMPESEVLIICPKGAIPQWRRTLARSPARARLVKSMCVVISCVPTWRSGSLPRVWSR